MKIINKKCYVLNRLLNDEGANFEFKPLTFLGIICLAAG